MPFAMSVAIVGDGVVVLTVRITERLGAATGGGAIGPRESGPFGGQAIEMRRFGVGSP